MQTIHYDELSEKEKLELMEKSIPFLSLKPDFLATATSYNELIDRVTEFSKALYERFPKKRGTVDQVPFRT